MAFTDQDITPKQFLEVLTGRSIDEGASTSTGSSLNEDILAAIAGLTKDEYRSSLRQDPPSEINTDIDFTAGPDNKRYPGYDPQLLSAHRAGQDALKIGSRGDEVKAFQIAINIIRQRDGLPPIEEDGIYGGETAGAVHAFQTSYGLDENGDLVRITRENLNLALHPDSKVGPRVVRALDLALGNNTLSQEDFARLTGGIWNTSHAPIAYGPDAATAEILYTSSNSVVDSLYESLAVPETGPIRLGNLLDDDDRFIRTRVQPEGDISTAFGPVQITVSLAQRQLREYGHTFTAEERAFAERFIVHGKKLFNAKADDPVHGYGGSGSLIQNDRDRKLYEQFAKRLIENTYRFEARGDTTEARIADTAVRWRGVGPSGDPHYHETVATEFHRRELARRYRELEAEVASNADAESATGPS